MTLPVSYDAALAALSSATMAQAQEILAQAEGVEAFARRARDPSLLDHAVAVSLAAKRRAGELLRQMADEGARNVGGRPAKRSRETTVTLADLCVTKQQSHSWQKLSGLSDEDFTDVVAARQKDARRALEASRAERAQEKKAKRAEREEKLAAKARALPEKRYTVILEDPEWDSTTWSDAGRDRHAENHYPVSSLDEICARDVGSLAFDDCVLFLWIPTSFIGALHRVLEARGFEFKSMITWVKDRHGNGRWVWDWTEHLVIATRGAPPCPAPGTQPDSRVFAPVGAHSAKPEVFVEIIEKMFPSSEGLRIELNRRGPPRPGWDAWGNEAEGSEAA